MSRVLSVLLALVAVASAQPAAAEPSSQAAFRAVPGAIVFHAGTKAGADGSITTNGGRVLTVSAVGPDLAAARDRAYEAAALISWPGLHYRRDIAAQALP